MIILPPPLRQGAARFWQWWTGELLALLPAGLRDRLTRSRQRLVVEISDTKASFLRGKGGALKRIGTVAFAGSDPSGPPGAGQIETVQRIVQRADLRGAEVVLRLPREKVLRRLVDLPAAAAENLREVLGFEMDRHTPFKAHDVYFDFRVSANDPQRKRIKVDLVVIPKEALDQVLRLTGAWGLDLDLLDMAGDAPDEEQLFDLLPQGARKSRGRMRRRAAITAGAFCALALAAAVYLPLEQNRQTLAELEAEVAQVRVAAAKVDEMREQVQDLATRSRFVVDQKRRQRTATELLDEVTRLLPDNTWVLKFGVRNNLLTVSGYSAKPSALIGLLEESEMLASVRFSSPVTMDQKVGLERFNLTASVIGREG